mmetsp:Transcript_18167/g.57060  ORF Transcript_18167/g.57060 Transcript_18167/m.57060 type:complete len:244 (-) Transcript_18167:79-810(-)
MKGDREQAGRSLPPARPREEEEGGGETGEVGAHGVGIGLDDEDIEGGHARADDGPDGADGLGELGEGARREEELGDETPDDLLRGNEGEGHADEVEDDAKAEGALDVDERDVALGEAGIVPGPGERGEGGEDAEAREEDSAREDGGFHRETGGGRDEAGEGEDDRGDDAENGLGPPTHPPDSPQRSRPSSDGLGTRRIGARRGRVLERGGGRVEGFAYAAIVVLRRGQRPKPARRDTPRELTR